MTPENLIQNAILPALKLLPGKMDSPAARAMLIAIALQESRIAHRAQIGGPARGYWQFEMYGGVKGVLNHPASQAHIRSALLALDYSPDSKEPACYIAIEHNDVLAACFARLLLWTLPQPLPAQNNPAGGWSQYIAAWRPGKPHRDTFDGFYADAWDLAK